MNIDSLRFGIKYTYAGIATRSNVTSCDLIHHDKSTLYAYMSDLGLHCLYVSHKKDTILIWDNIGQDKILFESRNLAMLNRFFLCTADCPSLK